MKYIDKEKKLFQGNITYLLTKIINLNDINSLISYDNK